MGYKTPPKEHQFSSTKQPKNSGRKPDKLKKFTVDNGLTATDITNTIKYIMPLTEDEIKTLGEDKDSPILMRMFVAAIASDIDAGSVNNLMRMLDRAYGAPKQSLEMSVDNDAYEKLKELYGHK